MSPVQIWVLASTNHDLSVSFSRSTENRDQLFNNADSFSQAFDEAWELFKTSKDNDELSLEKKRNFVLEKLKDHPFMVASPAMALAVVKFRMRLRDLK